MTWPFTGRAARASQGTTTLQVVAGDGADGTAGPDAARHGGAVTVTSPAPSRDADRAAAERAAAWDAWPVNTAAFAEALAAAERFTEHEATLTTAPPWSARVDAAVHGMDTVDPAGLDAWMQVHADSARPELDEARLVAAWETHQDAATDTADAATATEATEAAEAAEVAESAEATEAAEATDCAHTGDAATAASETVAEEAASEPVAEDGGDVAEDGW